MVHGNYNAVMLSSKINPSEYLKNIRPAVSERKGVFKYIIQKPFSYNLNHNLLFSNPLKRNVKTIINDINYNIPSMGCIIIKPKLNDNMKIEIKSDFFFPRPIVFSFNKKFIDCHHA